MKPVHEAQARQPVTPPSHASHIRECDPSMYELANFSLADMTRCGIELRRAGAGAATMEDVAGRVVNYLYANLREPSSEGPACALVRMFVTLPFSSLDEEQRAAAAGMLGDVSAAPGMKCLTLLATAGNEPAWNSRRTSVAHKALPLPSAESIARAPMLAQLIRQLGVEVGMLLSPENSVLIDRDQHTFNVFYVAEAKGSPHIPSQREFVEPYGIRSVLGFGGLLPTGDLFTTILFARVHVRREIADLFRTLALNVKVAILPYTAARVFA